MKRGAAVLALLAIFALPAHAQSLSGRLADIPDISFETWQEMTNGKTVVYELDGEIFGLEAYRKDSNRVLFRTATGICDRGTWAMDGPAFCFQWEASGEDCFLHKQMDGEIFIIGLDNGVATDNIQKVARIADIPVACGPALLSQLMPEALP